MSAGLALLIVLALLAPGARTAGARAAEPRSQASPAPATTAELAARPLLMRSLLDVRFLEAKLERQDDVLADLSREAARLARERRVVDEARSAQAGRLRDMLPGLWAMDVGLRGVMEAPLVSWDEADRNLNWLAAAFEGARGEMARLGELAGLAARQAVLAPEALAQARAGEALRDRLLAERLKLMAQLSDVRREKPSPAERLERVLEQVERARLTPLSALDRPLEGAEGGLPWPVAGHAVVSPASAPAPEPGASVQAVSPPGAVALATAPEAPVAAVHWGRVAFADEVKGLGKVVVVAHGGGYMSIYGHLGRATVKPGQEVARGDVLGAAGGLANGVFGMTFELRFGLKPINPSRWLLAG